MNTTLPTKGPGRISADADMDAFLRETQERMLAREREFRAQRGANIEHATGQTARRAVSTGEAHRGRSVLPVGDRD